MIGPNSSQRSPLKRISCNCSMGAKSFGHLVGGVGDEVGDVGLLEFGALAEGSGELPLES